MKLSMNASSSTLSMRRSPSEDELDLDNLSDADAPRADEDDDFEEEETPTKDDESEHSHSSTPHVRYIGQFSVKSVVRLTCHSQIGAHTLGRYLIDTNHATSVQVTSPLPHPCHFQYVTPHALICFVPLLD
jgi:hypothetical protein